MTISKRAQHKILMRAHIRHGDAAYFVHDNKEYPIHERFASRRSVYKSALIRNAKFNHNDLFFGIFLFTPKSFALVKVVRFDEEVEKVEFIPIEKGLDLTRGSIGSEVPSYYGDIWIASYNARVMEAVKRSAAISPINILLKGRPGVAKTSLLKAFAKSVEMKYIRITCASIREPEEWFIYRELKDSNTVESKTDMSKIIEQGNAIICLDDASRARPHIWNPMFSMLDDDRKVSIHGVDIVCGPNVIFAMTANIGWNYVGTFELDPALESRIGAFLEIGVMPEREEITLLILRTNIDKPIAVVIVEFMVKLRNIVQKDGMDNEEDLEIDPSPRSSLGIARLMSVGLSFRDAVYTVIKARSSRQKLVSDLVNTISYDE